MADTTTTTSLPARRASTMRCATRLIFSASPTEEPPYFCTTSAITGPLPSLCSICAGRTLSLRNTITMEDSARAAPGRSTDFRRPGSRGLQRIEFAQGDGDATIGRAGGAGRARRRRGLHRDVRVPSGVAGRNGHREGVASRPVAPGRRGRRDHYGDAADDVSRQLLLFDHGGEAFVPACREGRRTAAGSL